MQDLEKKCPFSRHFYMRKWSQYTAFIRKKRQLDAVAGRKFVVTNVHICHILTSHPCAVMIYTTCACGSRMQGAPLPLDALDIRWKAPEYRTWSQHTHGCAWALLSRAVAVLIHLGLALPISLTSCSQRLARADPVGLPPQDACLQTRYYLTAEKGSDLQRQVSRGWSISPVFLSLLSQREWFSSCPMGVLNPMYCLFEYGEEQLPADQPLPPHSTPDHLTYFQLYRDSCPCGDSWLLTILRGVVTDLWATSSSGDWVPTL